MAIKFHKINKDNLKLALEIQKTIFPKEDGTLNYLESVEKKHNKKQLDYYIVVDNDVPIGITGIFSYHEYPEDAWLGWFGVLPNFRNKGYGSEILDKTIKLAKEGNYKTFRLYTDDNYKIAHILYTKKGMIKEEYNNIDDKLEQDNLITYIFSLSLTENKIKKWDNKFLGLKEQDIKKHNICKDKMINNYNLKNN